MQVFVPYPDLKQSVQCLDKSRLGNQVYRECLTILSVLKKGPTTPKGNPTGWYNHPATQMWYNHSYFLCEYAFAGLEELSYRGLHYPNIFDKVHEIQLTKRDTGPPMWWGDNRVHLSHRSSLLQKDPDHYRQYFEGTPKMDYFWPVINKEEVVSYGMEYQRRKEEERKKKREERNGKKEEIKQESREKVGSI